MQRYHQKAVVCANLFALFLLTLDYILSIKLCWIPGFLTIYIFFVTEQSVVDFLTQSNKSITVLCVRPRQPRLQHFTFWFVEMLYAICTIYVYSRTIWEVILASFEQCRCKFQKRFICRQTRHNCCLQGLLHLFPTSKKSWLCMRFNLRFEIKTFKNRLPCSLYYQCIVYLSCLFHNRSY